MSNLDTEVLELMYRLMNAMDKLGYPIRFKGAMALRAFTLSNREIRTARMTQDIDGEWSHSVSNELLLSLLREALNHASLSHLEVEQRRKFSERTSASFIFRENGEKVFSMDIKVTESFNPNKTRLNVDGLSFESVTLAKMIADKTSVVSSRKIYRRVKDLYDLYVLSHFEGYSTNEIVSSLELSGYVIGDFEDFKNGLEGKAGIVHAYNQMMNVENKPNFFTIYNTVDIFLDVFISGDYLTSNYTWMSNNQTGIREWVKH